MVATAVKSAPLPACASLGTLVRLEAAATILKVTGACETDGALTLTPATPAFDGSRTKTSAMPAPSVMPAAAESCTPGDAWKVTGAPATGVLEESSSATCSESGSTDPGIPVCASPWI